MKAPFLGGTSSHSPSSLTCSPGTSSWAAAVTATTPAMNKSGVPQKQLRLVFNSLKSTPTPATPNIGSEQGRRHPIDLTQPPRLHNPNNVVKYSNIT